MKPSVSKSLSLLLTYFLTVIFGTIFTTSLYVVYETCMNLVAGATSQFFDSSYIVSGILVTMPVVLNFSGLVLCLYLVKHTKREKLPTVIYYVLCAITWFGLMPLIFFCGSKYGLKEKLNIQKDVNISSGYFRTDGDYTFYYSNVSDENVADGLVINFSGEGEDIYTFENMKLPSSHDGFTDSLIEKNVKLPYFMEFTIKAFRLYLKYASESMERGYLSWLCFAFISFAYCTIVEIRNISRWRLINLLNIIFVSIIVFIFNMYVLSGKLFGSVSEKLNSVFKFIPDGSNSFLIICNLTFFIIFIVCGVIISAINKKRDF